MTEYGNGGGYTVTMDGPFGGGGGGSSSEKMISIHAPVSDWKGATSPYSQVVEVYGLNIGSKVDIQISTQLLEQLSQQRIWFTTENRGGVVTLFAVGDKPAIDCEFQATLSDVANITGEDIEAIRGNTVSTVIPQGDFAQKDPNKSDFIKNKPAPFVVSNEKPEGAAIWFNKKENLDDTTDDAHIMAHDLNMGQHQLYGVPTPTANDHAANMGYVNAQAKKAAPRNLLDNSDFRNPVNQRGQDSYSLGVWGGYTIDRWYVHEQDTSLSFADNGIQLTGVLAQAVPSGTLTYGKQYTMAVKVNGEVYCASGIVVNNENWYRAIEYWDENFHFQLTGDSYGHGAGIYGTNVVYEWAALYEGEYTLDTLPEYQPKGYGAELAECMRYYQVLPFKMMTATSQSALLPSREFKVPMRVIPTATIFTYAGDGYVATWGNDTAFTVSVAMAKQDGLDYVTVNEPTQAGQPIAYGVKLSADL